MTDLAITRALVTWTGWGTAMIPTRDDSAVLSDFGQEVLNRVLELEADFFQSRAAIECPTMNEVASRAAAEFRALHPEVGDDGVRALTGSYTFAWK